MRRTVIAVSLLMLVHLLCATAASLFSNRHGEAAIAPVALAQVSLLVVWSVLGPGHLAFRVQAIPFGVGAIVSVMLMCRMIPREDAGGEWGVLVSLGLTLLIPLAVLRNFGLRIAAIDPTVQGHRSAMQFSIRNLLAVMLAAGLLLALWRLNPLAGHYGNRPMYIRDDMQMGSTFLLLLISLWAGSADRPLFIRLSVLAVAVVMTALLTPILAVSNYPVSFWPRVFTPELRPAWVYSYVYCTIVGGSLLGLQLLGYRLVWSRDPGSAMTIDTPIAAVAGSSSSRNQTVRDAALGILIVSHVLMQFLLISSQLWLFWDRQSVANWFVLLFMAQQLALALLAVWATLGPGRWFVRLTGVFLCMAMLFGTIALVSSDWRWVLPTSLTRSTTLKDWLSFLVGQFLCICGSFVLLRLLGARIRRLDVRDQIAAGSVSWQFQLLGLLAGAVCSVTLWVFLILPIGFGLRLGLVTMPDGVIAYSLCLGGIVLLSAWTGLATYRAFVRVVVFLVGMGFLALPSFLFGFGDSIWFFSALMAAGTIAWATFAIVRACGMRLEWKR